MGRKLQGALDSRMRSERIVTRDAAELAERAAAWIAARLHQAVSERGGCALALTGGRTPEPVYRALAERPGLPWPAVSVFFGDERAVPPEHPESNYAMAFATLLSRVALPPVQIHRMQAERSDLEQAAREYAALLPQRLDLLLLGIGADGHTASLFPGAGALAERERRVVTASGGQPPRARLTITPPVIAAARSVLVMATGTDKAPAVARALAGDAAPETVPATLARGGTWILDRAAAAELPAGFA